MELAYNFNFLEKSTINTFYLTHNNDEILINFLYQMKEKNKEYWSRNELIYLHSIFTNICKFSGSLQLDSYDALYEFYCLLQQKNFYNNLQYQLRDIDTRLFLNRNSTHQNHLQNLPFGLRYILHPRFFYAFFAGICVLSKWFFEVYIDMVLSVFLHMNNTKISLGQVLYTEYFLHDRAALISTLSENLIFVKTIEAYNMFLQFSMTFEQIFKWVWIFLSKICFSWDVDKIKNEGIVWSFFETHLKLSLPMSIKNENNNFLESFLPNFVSHFFHGENLSKNTMKAMRLGATPSRDLTILMETINKVTEEGEYIKYILSSCLSIFFLLLVTYFILYLSSWFLSYRLKARLFQKINL